MERSRGMKKRKFQNLEALPDIRSFFKASLGKNGAASSIAYGEVTIIGIPGTDGATPSPGPSRAPGQRIVPTVTTANASQPLVKTGSIASSQETIEIEPLEPTVLRKRPIRSSTPQTAAGTRKIQAPIYKREGKENGPGAIAGVGTAASMTSASRAMSSLYLFGPLLTVRDTRNKLRCSPQSQNRFPLPVGKSMLGRNSIRDGFPGNSNKIRIGIDALEEGVSRSQVTLQVSASRAYIVVTNNPNAMNPIRVRRRTAAQGSSALELKRSTAPQAVEKAATAAPASQDSLKPPEVQVLNPGQTAKVYPGDTLQLDGFRHPDRSRYSYVLHSLLMDGAKPAGVDANASAGEARTSDQGAVGRDAAEKCRDSMVAGISDLRTDGASREPVVDSSVSCLGEAMPPLSFPLSTEETAKKPRISPADEKHSVMAPSGAPAVPVNPVPSTIETVVVAPFTTLLTLVDAGGDEASSITVLNKRSRSENGDGVSSLLGSSKSSCHSSPGTSVTCRSGPFHEGIRSGASNTTGAIESPPVKDEGQEVINGDRSSGVTLPNNSEDFTADARRLTVTSETVAKHTSAAGRTSGIAMSPSDATAAPESKMALPPESKVMACDGVDVCAATTAESDVPQTPFAPGKHGSSAVGADVGDRDEGMGDRAADGALWGVGDVVQLSPRMGKGENKLGGIAHVKRVFKDGTYLVKLVLPGAAPTRVSADLLSRFDPPPDGLATRGRRSLSGSKGDLPPKRGDRARVLFDVCNWYMGTVVRVHNASEVIVRYDGGSEEKVALVPGEAETCSDNDLSPSLGAQLMKATLSRSRVGNNRGSRSSRGRGSVGKGWRALDPWGALVLSDEDAKLLTKARATALLDTAPEKLIGLTYQKRVNKFGWANAVIREVVHTGAGDKSRSMDPGWPEAVLVDTGTGGDDESDGDFVRPGNFSSRRKIRAFLSELQAWDKQWRRTANGRKASSERSSERVKRSPSRKAAATKAASARSPSSGKKTHHKSPGTRSPGVTTRGVARLKTVVPVREGKTPKGRRSRARAVIRVSGGSVTLRKASRGKTVEITPSPLRQADSSVEGVGVKVMDAKKATADKRAIAKQAREVAKKQAALKRESAAERGRTVCPFCSSEFYSTESREAVDAHLAVCSRKMAETEATSSTGGDVTRAVENSVFAGREDGAVMTMSLSSALSIYVKGRDLGNLTAALEGLVAQGVRPTSALCDRVMQEMLQSRCYFRTEYLRRIIKNCLTAYPTCWQPLNWGVFEETLQLLAKERNPLALNAHAVAIGVSLDCLEVLRRRRQTVAVGEVPLPPLFLGIEGDKSGRAVVKRCARWAAMAWARRGEAALVGDEAQVNVCMVMSRVVGECLEAYSLAGKGRAAVLEGCQLAAVELQSHGEVAADAGGSEMAARCLAGLLRPLSGRPFFPTLAEVLLHNIPTEEGGVYVELLKDMLSRHVGQVRAAGGNKRGRAKATGGCAMLFADLAT